jgi:hypothetical protein
MGVEGLWWFQTTSLQNPTAFEWGGVVVLETNRILGGDSVYSYIGNYEVHGEEFRAQVRVKTWNHDVQAENVFGMSGPLDYEVEVRGVRQENIIVGHLNPVAAPDVKLPARMVFIENLP